MLAEQTEAPRSQLTCLRPHSWQMMEPGFEPAVWLFFFFALSNIPFSTENAIHESVCISQFCPILSLFQQSYLNELNAEDMNIFQCEKEHQSENFSYFSMFVLKLNLTSQNSFFRLLFSFIPGLKRTMPPFYFY